MYKISIIFFFSGLLSFANPMQKDTCEQTNKTFTQSDFLIKSFQDYKGAENILNQSSISYLFMNPKFKELKCVQKHFNSWINILYKNKKIYPLKNLSKIYKDTPLIPLYLGNIYKDRDRYKKALSYYEKYIKLQKTAIDPTVLAYIKRGGKKLYKSKWAKHLNPKNLIPEKKFKNIFFNLSNKNIVKTTYSNDIKIFAVAKLFNKNTNDISSYHVGKIYFDTNTTQILSFDCGDARGCRLIIDDLLISKRALRQKIYHFTQGMHKIEIEYLNHSPVYSLKFSLSPFKEKLSKKALKKTFHGTNADIWLVNYKVGYKESIGKGGITLDMKTNTPTITLKQSKKPIILFLQSNDYVQWRLKNTKNVEAILIGYHNNKLDDIQIDSNEDKVSYTSLDLSVEAYPSTQPCLCTPGGIFLCKNLLTKANEIKSIFGKNITTYTYSKEQTFIVPDTYISPSIFEKEKTALLRKKQLCKENKLDKIFNK